MTAAPVLLAFAGLLACFAPRLADRSRLDSAAPRLAIAVWFAMAASSVLALTLAGLAVLLPLGVFDGHPDGVVESCVAELSERFGTVGGLAVAVAAAVMVGAIVIRLCCAGLAVARSTSAERASLHQCLRHVRRDPRLGVAIVDDPAPAAYCVPGGGGLIAVTTGALDLLDRPELDAVLAHERAHLAGRHHLLMAIAQTGRRAFGRLPLFAVLPERIAHLVELSADDAAVRRASRTSLARSLLHFAAAQTPTDALAASGGDTVARVERLLTAPARPGLGAAIGRRAALAAPAALVAAPIVTAALMACCQS
jgi:Zn-dependent protease with chaperone function